ncbi:MAG: sarcosine oxidase [Woeseia sp.]
MNAPDRHLRRSPIYRRHLALGASFTAFADAAVVTEYGDARDEQATAVDLAIADLSVLPRSGFRGKGAAAWLEGHDIGLPSSANKALRQADGSLVARLSNDEYLLLGNLTDESGPATRTSAAWSLDTTDHVYDLPRADSHGWLAVTGGHASSMLAKVCGVDLRLQKFPDGDVAQTSVARTNAIVIRADRGSCPCFFILGDASVTEYLWGALLDAMREFGGRAIGIAALRALRKSSTPPINEED